MKVLIPRSHTLGLLVLALGLTAACSEQTTPQPKMDAQPASAATGVPEATQVGVVPAGPGKETPSTTSPVKSDMSKAQQSAAMPMPGQVNDHSTLATPSEKTSSTPR